MAETPDIEISDAESPDVELHDHRHQDSMPRAGSSNTARPSGMRRSQRRSTAGTAGTAGTSASSQAPYLRLSPEIDYSTRVIDFEEAILDDDKSAKSGKSGNSGTAGHRSRFLDRDGSVRSNVSRRTRRDTFRGPRPSDEPRSRSTASTRRSSSSSRPNSVDAFAEPRRRERTRTAESQPRPPPLLSPEHALNRPHSASDLRRPETRSTIKEDDMEDDIEDDVCYPPTEEDAYSIDFEDLEDFIQKNDSSTPVACPVPSLRPGGDSNQEQPTKNASPKDGKRFKNKAAKGKRFVPKIFGKTARRASSGADTINTFPDVDEKKLDLFDSDELPRLAPTPTLNGNRWSFFTTELEDTIHAPELGDLLMPGETFQHLFELGPDGGCWWLDIMMPTEEEVEVICKAFGIHGLTREDIIQQETREKVEIFKTYYFVCFRSFYHDKDSVDYMEPVNVYAVAFREGILTFTFCPSPHAGNVRKRMSRLRDYVSLGADWICYALIDDIVDSFGPLIHDIEVEADCIEESVFTARYEDSRPLLRRIGKCRKKLLGLIKLLSGKADVVKGFAKRCNEQDDITPRKDVGMYLSDIQDHIVTMMSSLTHFERLLSRSHANYLAQISVDHMEQGNRANEVLSKVTFIATILVPMNLVCGLFGMNVEVPGKNQTGLGWFFGILGLLLGFCITCAVVARKLKYI